MKNNDLDEGIPPEVKRFEEIKRRVISRLALKYSLTEGKIRKLLSSTSEN